MDMPQRNRARLFKFTNTHTVEQIDGRLKFGFYYLYEIYYLVYYYRFIEQIVGV